MNSNQFSLRKTIAAVISDTFQTIWDTQLEFCSRFRKPQLDWSLMFFNGDCTIGLSSFCWQTCAKTWAIVWKKGQFGVCLTLSDWTETSPSNSLAFNASNGNIWTFQSRLGGDPSLKTVQIDEISLAETFHLWLKLWAYKASRVHPPNTALKKTSTTLLSKRTLFET